jgi:hypothetical protein
MDFCYLVRAIQQIKDGYDLSWHEQEALDFVLEILDLKEDEIEAWLDGRRQAVEDGRSG